MSLAGIWGAGAEGRSAAHALLAQGFEAVVVDESDAARPADLDERADFASGSEALNRLLGCTVVVCSPGIPGTHPFRARLDAASVPTTTLSDLWMRSHSQATIGVTGTKGKSTTTTLIRLLLDAAGCDTQLGGNIGIPLADLRPDAGVTVAELSSYQCASLRHAPRLAVITSLYQDHLTWHGSKERYWLDKARILGPGAEALVCDEDTRAKLRSVDAALPPHILTPDDGLRDRVSTLVTSGPLALPQNASNLALAVLAAERWLARPLSDDEATAAIARFAPLPHRLATVFTHHDVTWIDDTLATVPESVIAALEAFPGETVLIVGGQDRGLDYGVLTDYLNAREPRPRLITIPSNGDRIAAGYRARHPRLVHRAPSLEAAVERAAQLAAPGTTVVLSPGAPSYDRFTSFAHKSAAFEAAIRRTDAGA